MGVENGKQDGLKHRWENPLRVQVPPRVQNRGNVSRMRPQSDSFKQRVRGGFHDVADNPRHILNQDTTGLQLVGL